MSEEKQPEGENKVSPQMVLQRIYLKDLSFESPRPVQAFTEALSPPEINLQLNNHTEKIKEDQFEVTLEITVTAQEKEAKTVYYLAELKQAGLFRLTGFSDSELATTVNSLCPGILFPYARETISNVVERGGFPQLLLAPINFDAIYQQHLQKLKQAQDGDSDGQAKH